MNPRTVLFTASFAIAAIAPAWQSSATYIYIAEYNSGIWKVDPDAGTRTKLLAAAVFNLAMDPLGGGLYYAGSPPAQLWRLDLTTKIATSMGGIINGNSMSDGTGGFLFVGQDAQLHRINPNGGLDVLIGTGSTDYAGDLAASASDVMYGALRGKGTQWENYLVTVDLVTGAQTPVAPLGMAFDGLAFSEDGRLWGTADTSDWLYLIDPATGKSTPVLDLGFKAHDMASEVPAPGAACLLVLAGAAGFRRRR